MRPTYIVFGYGRFWVTYSCLGGYLLNKKEYKKDGFGFVEYTDRRVETLKRLGFKEY